MHKSAISVWKAARANVPDFPDCFPGMNEAQFANLAFDLHCHVSSTPMSRMFMVTLSLSLSLLGLPCPQYSLCGLDTAGAPLSKMHKDEVSESWKPFRNIILNSNLAMLMLR